MTGTVERGAMDPGLPERLRKVRELLRPLEGAVPAADRAADRLDRDLLPRTVGGDAYLVAGIVGPNNAGKSALFNALAGRELSPSVPSGGATRRLLGAAHPGLLARLQADASLSRFHLSPVETGQGPLKEVCGEWKDAAELLIAAEPTLPPGLMLIDTPDFDSIFRENRVASEALLAVADLAVAVVTRHSYQNNEVVRFLEHWFQHGRPWMLVYNEAPDREVAAAHAAKLTADVGHPPLAAFWAPHDLGIARGEARMDPQSLQPGGRSLRESLFDLEEVAGLKQQALRASLAALRHDLREAGGVLEGRAERARELLDAAEEHTRALARELALAAMPLPAFLEAFRAVLDRRTNAFSRGLRATLRRAGDLLAAVPNKLLGRKKPGAEQAPSSLAQAERQRLKGPLWSGFWEEIVHDLGRAARSPARQACEPSVTVLLDADLALEAEDAALGRTERALAATAPDSEFALFRAACEQLVEEEVGQKGREWLLQRAADVVTLAPLIVSTVFIVQTGGLGPDVLVGGAGSGLSVIMERKLTRLLGSGVAERARKRWAELRSGQLAGPLADAVLTQTAPVMRTTAHAHSQSAQRLRELADSL